jgi:hypothetical protein
MTRTRIVKARPMKLEYLRIVTEAHSEDDPAGEFADYCVIAMTEAEARHILLLMGLCAGLKAADSGLVQAEFLSSCATFLREDAATTVVGEKIVKSATYPHRGRFGWHASVVSRNEPFHEEFSDTILDEESCPVTQANTVVVDDCSFRFEAVVKNSSTVGSSGEIPKKVITDFLNTMERRQIRRSFGGRG